MMLLYAGCCLRLRHATYLHRLRARALIVTMRHTLFRCLRHAAMLSPYDVAATAHMLLFSAPLYA